MIVFIPDIPPPRCHYQLFLRTYWVKLRETRPDLLVFNDPAEILYFKLVEYQDDVRYINTDLMIVLIPDTAETLAPSQVIDRHMVTLNIIYHMATLNIKYHMATLYIMLILTWQP